MIVITGGSGFIGSQIGRRLNETRDRSDILVVDELGKDEKWKNLRHFSFLDYIDKKKFLEKLETGSFDMGQIDCVFHMGACSSTTEKDLDFLMENNFGYSKTLFGHCANHRVRFVYASSAATYGDGAMGYDDETPPEKLLPLNGYGFSKQIFDLWLLRHGHAGKCVGLKFFNVYGPGEAHKEDMSSVVFKAFHQIRSSGKVKLFKSHREDYADGEQLRDFIYVKDAVDICLHMMENPGASGIHNAGTGQARSFLDLALATFSAMDVPPEVEFIDMPESLREKYQYFTEAKMNKLTQSGYSKTPFSLKEGVKDYVQNYLANELFA